MKENNENVTDSVTDDIQTISDNMKQLAENTPKNVVKPDVYASKLPLIIEELRADDKQTVEEKEWYRYVALSETPVAGAIYMLMQGDEKNRNKKNFCMAAFKVNIVYTVVFILISVVIFIAGTGIGRQQADTANKIISEEQSEKLTDEDTQKVSSLSPGHAIDNDLKNTTEYYVYNEDSKTLDFTLDGVEMNYPVTAKQLKTNGYTYMSQVSQPYSQAVISSYGSPSGTKAALTIALTDLPQDDVKCSEMQVDFSSKTEMLGLDKDSDVDRIRSVFAGADKEDMTEYNESTKNGSVVYTVGSLKLSVSLKNGTVSSLKIKQI